MKTFRFKKSEVLEKIRANRGQHTAIFEKALAGYKARLLSILEQNLIAVKAGKEACLTDFHLIRPRNETAAYDRAILMLEMTIDEEVELSEQDFAQFIMDDWQWKQNFLHSNAAYSRTATALLAGHAED